MTLRFKPQIESTNFVYPNKRIVEYDRDIIHQTTNDAPIGSISGLTFDATPSSQAELRYDFSWDLNGGVPVITKNDQLLMVAVNLMEHDQEYIRPWRVVSTTFHPVTGTTSISASVTTQIEEDLMGIVGGWQDSIYYFEFQLISKNAITSIFKETRLRDYPQSVFTYFGNTTTPSDTQSEACADALVDKPLYSGFDYLATGMILYEDNTLQTPYTTSNKWLAVYDGSDFVPVQIGEDGSILAYGNVCGTAPTPNPYEWSAASAPSDSEVDACTDKAIDINLYTLNENFQVNDYIFTNSSLSTLYTGYANKWIALYNTVGKTYWPVQVDGTGKIITKATTWCGGL